MQFNIGEVTFNTEFARKHFGSRTFFFKFKGVGCTSTKRKNFFLICGIIFFSMSILLIESTQILKNINTVKSPYSGHPL